MKTRKEFVFFTTFLINPGQKKLVEVNKGTEWSILYVHRVELPDIESNEQAALLGQYSVSPNKFSKTEILVKFESREITTIQPNVDIGSSASIVFSAEGSALRLFLATKFKTSLNITNFKLQKPAFFNESNFPKIAHELIRIYKSDKPLHLLMWFLELFPQKNYFDDSQEAFPNLISSFISAICEKLGDKLASEFVSLLHNIDLSLTLGNQMNQSTAGLILTIARLYPQMILKISATFVYLHNCITFIAVLSDINQRLLLLKFLNSDFGYNNETNAKEIIYLFSYTTKYKLRVHYNLFNIYAKIATIDELKLLYNMETINKLTFITRPNPLKPKRSLKFHQNEELQHPKSKKISNDSAKLEKCPSRCFTKDQLIELKRSDGLYYSSHNADSDNQSDCFLFNDEDNEIISSPYDNFLMSISFIIFLMIMIYILHKSLLF